MPPRFWPSYSVTRPVRRAPCRSMTSRAGFESVKSWTTAAPCRSMTTSTLPLAARTLTPRTSPSRTPPSSPQGPGARGGGPRARPPLGEEVPSWRLLMLGERQRFLPLEPEFLNGEDDLAGPDLRHLQTPDDVARFHPVDATIGDVAQHGDTARREPAVVHDGRQLQIGKQRPHVARLEQRHERITAAAFVREHFAQQRLRLHGRRITAPLSLLCGRGSSERDQRQRHASYAHVVLPRRQASLRAAVRPTSRTSESRIRPAAARPRCRRAVFARPARRTRGSHPAGRRCAAATRRRRDTRRFDRNARTPRAGSDTCRTANRARG